MSDNGSQKVIVPRGTINPQIWSIVNQKGGVGKTTTAVNLATALAALSYKVLLIDLDPQGNASTGLGIHSSLRSKNIYIFLKNDIHIGNVILLTSIPNLYIIPSDTNLSGCEIEFLNEKNKLYLLKEKLYKNKDYINNFDYIIMDCPPSLGFLTVNSLSISNDIIVPLQCEFFALEGLSQLLISVKKIKKNINPTLNIKAVVLTMFDQRNNLSLQVATDVRKFLDKIVCKTVIPRNIRLSEAPSHGKPALIYDLKCAGSQAYLRLTRELLMKGNKNGK